MRAVRLLGVLLFTLACGVVYGQECKPWQAKLVSTQGTIEYKLPDKDDWLRGKLGQTYCSGTVIRSLANSRAAIELVNETIIRLDAHSTLTLSNIKKGESSLLELIKGAIHFITRIPRSLKVDTPYVNAAVEGTEFLIRVEAGQSQVLVYEGTVMASNDKGQLRLNSGESAIAKQGQAPTSHIVVRPRDGVRWSLYYPPVIEIDKKSIVTEGLKQAIEAYEKNELSRAFKILAEVEPNEAGTEFYLFRASLFLTVGRVEAANKDLIKLDNQESAEALALRSIIATANNENDKAIQFANDALLKKRNSSPALLALSYAHQSKFELVKALNNAEKARKTNENSIVWSRLAELRLMNGYNAAARRAVKMALKINPKNDRAHNILGFILLIDSDSATAHNSFLTSININSSNPLAYLGLGLSTIKTGNLSKGRKYFEIAISLDPGNSVLRSYLGKAYYEENRAKVASTEFELAKQRDPSDPTPWFYSALAAKSYNQSIDAINNFKKAIELNNNRAIYRSSLFLDSDRAVKNSNIASIFSDLEMKSVSNNLLSSSLIIDPYNNSALINLAENQIGQYNSETARISQYFKGYLLQPIGAGHKQVSKFQANLNNVDFSGLSNLSFNEYSSLFNQNKTSVILSTQLGNHNTRSNELNLSSHIDRLALDLNQYYYDSDGFKDNSQIKHEIYALNLKYKISPRVLSQFTRNTRNSAFNEIFLNNDTNLVFPDNTKFEQDFWRANFVIKHTPSFTSILSSTNGTKNNVEFSEITPPITSVRSQLTKGNILQYESLYRRSHSNFVFGVRRSNTTLFDEFVITTPFGASTTPRFYEDKQRNAYIYLNFFSKYFRSTIGLNQTDYKFQSVGSDPKKLLPKLGLNINMKPFSFNLANFRNISTHLSVEHILEPSTISQFIQHNEDPIGTESETNAGSIVYLSKKSTVSASVTGYKRKLYQPILQPNGSTTTENITENIYSSEISYSPTNWLSLAVIPKQEVFSFRLASTKEIKNRSVSVFTKLFKGPLYIEAKGTHFDQSQITNSVGNLKNNFRIYDLSIGHKNSKSKFTVGLDIKNILDTSVNYQDKALTTASLRALTQPEFYLIRTILFKATLKF